MARPALPWAPNRAPVRARFLGVCACSALALCLTAGCGANSRPPNSAPGWIRELPGPSPSITISINLARMRADPIHRKAGDRKRGLPRIWPGFEQAHQVDAYVWLDAVEPQPRWEAILIAYGVDGNPGPASQTLQLEGLVPAPISLKKLGSSAWLVAINPGRRWQVINDREIAPKPMALASRVHALIEVTVPRGMSLPPKSGLTPDAEGIEMVRAELHGTTEKEWIRIEAWFDSDTNAHKAEQNLVNKYGLGLHPPSDSSVEVPVEATVLHSLFTIAYSRAGRKLTFSAGLAPWVASWLKTMQQDEGPRCPDNMVWLGEAMGCRATTVRRNSCLPGQTLVGDQCLDGPARQCGKNDDFDGSHCVPIPGPMLRSAPTKRSGSPYPSRAASEAVGERHCCESRG